MVLCYEIVSVLLYFSTLVQHALGGVCCSRFCITSHRTVEFSLPDNTFWVVFLSYSKESRNNADNKGGSLHIWQLAVLGSISPEILGKPELSWKDLSVFNKAFESLKLHRSFCQGFSVSLIQSEVYGFQQTSSTACQTSFRKTSFVSVQCIWLVEGQLQEMVQKGWAPTTTQMEKALFCLLAGLGDCEA